MCVYIMKKRVCIYMYMRVVLLNILVLQLGPLKQKFLTSPLLSYISKKKKKKKLKKKKKKKEKIKKKIIAIKSSTDKSKCKNKFQRIKIFMSL